MRSSWSGLSRHRAHWSPSVRFYRLSGSTRSWARRNRIVRGMVPLAPCRRVPGCRTRIRCQISLSSLQRSGSGLKSRRGDTKSATCRPGHTSLGSSAFGGALGLAANWTSYPGSVSPDDRPTWPLQVGRQQRRWSLVPAAAPVARDLGPARPARPAGALMTTPRQGYRLSHGPHCCSMARHCYASRHRYRQRRMLLAVSRI